MVILFIKVQPLITLPPIFSIFDGSFNAVSATQPSNALYCISFTLSGIVTFCKLVQPLKALFSINVTPSGIVTFFNVWQSKNILSGIAVIPFSKTAVSIKLSENAPRSISGAG